MGRTYEGLIEIPLGDFWAFVSKYQPNEGDEFAYGAPKVNKDNNTLEIAFAAGSDGHPTTWVEIPEAVRQWKEIP